MWGRAYQDRKCPYEYEHAVDYVARSVLTSWSTAAVIAMCLDGQVVGAIDIEVHARNATAEMGYSISKGHWGQGLVVEAVSAGMTWAFEAFDLAKIDRRDRRGERPVLAGDGKAGHDARRRAAKRTPK